MADGKRGRKKGTPKTGGRKKGTPNVLTSDLRSRISSFLSDNLDEAIKQWKAIEDPVQKVKLYTDLIKFAVPTLQAVSLDAIVNKEESVEDTLRKLSEEE